MHILALGDVVGDAGCKYVRAQLPRLKDRFKPDITVVNGENSCENGGINEDSAAYLFDCGADVITTGNHTFQNHGIAGLLERDIGLIRPANLHPDAPGCGVYVFERGKYRVAVVNLIGAVFLDLAFENPFLCADRLLKDIDCKTVIIDFHAEATSEKIALAKWVDGRASLVYGTHTHVPTADECILPGGTGFITDVGMCGPLDSVLGVDTEAATHFMITHLRRGKLVHAAGPCKIQGIYAETDDASGRCTHIERIEILQG